MMDVIEEIIKFRKDLDDAKKEIKGISGKNKKSAPAKKTKPAKVDFKICIKKERSFTDKRKIPQSTRHWPCKNNPDKQTR